MSSSETISPTAHYTGYVWVRNGLSHRELATTEGRVLFESLRPVMTANRLVGGGTLEGYLLARHTAIDALLEQAIEERGISQVVEIAAGLSARGWRFSRRYGERLTYIEADLPGMTERKRRALKKIGSLGEHHRVVEVDALKDQGPASLKKLVAGLDPRAGLAIITEGLLGYLPGMQVQALWRRIARALAGFAAGAYISDLHLGSVQNVQVRAFRVLLSAFVRGRVYLHFRSADEAVAALRAAGFEQAQLHRASDLAGRTGDHAGRASDHVGNASAGAGRASDPAAKLAHILEAST